MFPTPENIEDEYKTEIKKAFAEIRNERNGQNKNKPANLDELESIFTRILKGVAVPIAKQFENVVKAVTLSVTNTVTESVTSKYKKEIENLKKVNSEVAVETSLELDRHEQNSKTDMLRIHNVVETPNENTPRVVSDILTASGARIDPNFIAYAYRIGKPKTSGHRPIVCKILNKTLRNNILRDQKSKMKQSSAFQGKYPRVFITEELTKFRQHVAYHLRKDTENIKKSWSIDGKIKCVRTSDPENVITINSLDDLHQIGWSQERITELIDENLSLNAYKTRQTVETNVNPNNA